MILESLKNKNNDCICFYTPTHWAVVTWLWNSYQEPLVESSPHRLKLELTAGTISAVLVFLYRRGFCSPCPLPPGSELLTLTLVGFGRSKPECRDLDCGCHAGDCLGGELPYCVLLRTVTLPGYFVIQNSFRGISWKVHLMKTPWVLHDFKCPSNTLNLFCLVSLQICFLYFLP